MPFEQVFDQYVSVHDFCQHTNQGKHKPSTYVHVDLWNCSVASDVVCHVLF